MSGDWIRLHRKLLDSGLMHNHWLFTLWAWCLLKAQFRERFGLKPGQFKTGRMAGSEELNVTPSRFYRGLQSLEELGMISLEANSKWTTVTICNWQTYQYGEDGERTSSEHLANNQRTSSEHQTDTIEEGKKERRKERKKENPPSPPRGIVDLPPCLDSDEFRSAWGDWDSHRKAKRNKLTPQTIKAQLAKCEAWGEVKAIAAIRQSIEHGWTGLFEPGGPTGKQPQANRPSIGQQFLANLAKQNGANE